MLDIDSALSTQYPVLTNKPWLHKPLASTLKRLLNESDFQNFSQLYPHLKGIEFIDQVIDLFNVTYKFSAKEKERIPPSGRVVIIANHPIGSLDGLLLFKLIRDIRPDVKIVANHLLSQITPLDSCLLPVNNMSGSTPKENLQAIDSWLHNDGAIIIFPAGEVSRLKPSGVKDGKWHSGFLKIATKAHAPILPIYVHARNSALFYGTSMLYKPLSTLLLVKEMFKHENNQIEFRVGEAISYTTYSALSHLPKSTQIKLFHKHLYRIGKKKPGLLPTEVAIAHPEPRLELKAALTHCESLGQTPDGKHIYLYHYRDESPIMREVGRLREVSFRSVGEGSGRRRDVDRYDRHYYHLVLWDPNDLEIVGAYRFCDTKKLIAQYGQSELYSHSLFDYGDKMEPYLQNGLELGRSFIQPKYWGKRSLDYLWLGIGAFLAKNPQFRYLFGPVSISNSIPAPAKDLLIYFYRLYFGSTSNIACSKQPYQLEDSILSELKEKFEGNNYHRDLKQLKTLLSHFNVGIPTLYKQYSELCEYGGVQFADFNVDPEFANCVDGLVIVDLQYLKEKKRQRYITLHQHFNDNKLN
ncbi:lysophospholipid acyltransferase family protein [Vibrio sp. Of7-15]|uniref:GNAT family N-acyltransferase n=1 Tax=Vibrio sp. Of7-15 TaxID=2724879 RepID=UPI001EF2B967|nr:lysophospholipid acyltransferase family protein [Vibrio sp. Of7-15]MCG7497076.1 lysophospholipid acyltransferase family protein [Vibrio sp. Of7-15]